MQHLISHSKVWLQQLLQINYIHLEPLKEERFFISLRGPRKEVINMLENPRGPDAMCKEISQRVFSYIGESPPDQG